MLPLPALQFSLSTLQLSIIQMAVKKYISVRLGVIYDQPAGIHKNTTTNRWSSYFLIEKSPKTAYFFYINWKDIILTNLWGIDLGLKIFLLQAIFRSFCSDIQYTPPAIRIRVKTSCPLTSETLCVTPYTVNPALLASSFVLQIQLSWLHISLFKVIKRKYFSQGICEFVKFLFVLLDKIIILTL